MGFDVFAGLAEPGQRLCVHNVQLIAVQAGPDGNELLTIEHAGITRELFGAGRWNEEHSRRRVGLFGYIETAARIGRERLPAGACYFRDYIDQSLRRVPELDGSSASDPECVGWCCDERPQGFRAPVGIIPGKGGGFIPDRTVAVTLQVPPEFVRECRRVQMTPEALLRSFAGDLAGIQNFAAWPRGDNYGSNGSDERSYAEAWLERAHGGNAIDLEELETRDQDAEDRQFQRDDFAALLEDFEGYGGKADDLFAAVQGLVDKQAAVDSDSEPRTE